MSIDTESMSVKPAHATTSLDLDSDHTESVLQHAEGEGIEYLKGARYWAMALV